MTGTAIVDRRGAEGRSNSVPLIAAFVRGFSLEATRPSEKEVAALRGIVPAGTRIYLSAIPTRPPEEAIEAAKRLRSAGFEPVPHIAARMFATPRALGAFLTRLADEAGVERTLVIAGDREEPAGELRRAIDVIDRAVLTRHHIVEIGIAGYPEGHPRIAEQDLHRALVDKIAAAENAGLAVHIVSQFCFNANAIATWIGRLRDFGIEHPIRIGLAGPTSLPTLLRYAARCGVRASAQGLARQAGLMRQVFAMSVPDTLVRTLAEAHADRRLGEVAPHFFTFGGVAAAARWAAAVAAGRIVLENGGFQIEG
jgi:methylenetetrahydrofolate reductase (NADPH)